MQTHASNKRVLIFDLETIVDTDMTDRVHAIDRENTPVAALEAGKFPPPIFHKIVAIASLRLRQDNGVWTVEALRAPTCGEQTERELLRDFDTEVDVFNPLLVGFNSLDFDLSVLRYRLMLHELPGKGLQKKRYFYRFGDAHCDLCDTLSSFSARNRISLNTTCRALGIPAKLDGIDGRAVFDLVEQARFAELSHYAMRDALITALLWLRYELFCGRLSPRDHTASVTAIGDYLLQSDLPGSFGEFWGGPPWLSR